MRVQSPRRSINLGRFFISQKFMEETRTISIKNSKILMNRKHQKDLIETIKSAYPTAQILGFIRKGDSVKAVVNISHSDRPKS